MCDELKEGTVNYYHYLKAMELSERLQAELTKLSEKKLTPNRIYLSHQRYIYLIEAGLLEITGIFEPYNLFRGIPVVRDETLTNEIYIGVLYDISSS